MKRGKPKILKSVKKIVSREHYKVIKNLGNKEELHHTAAYAITAQFERQCFDLEKEITRLENTHRDVLFAHLKLLLVIPKIKYLKADFSQEEAEKIRKMIQEVQKEVHLLHGLVR